MPAEDVSKGRTPPGWESITNNPNAIRLIQIGSSQNKPADVIAVGFNARENAPLRGEIRVISADRVTDNRTGRSYFKAEIALLSDRQDGTLLARLTPGMPIEVVVPVAPRTAFDYLVAPLRESMRGAGREL